MKISARAMALIYITAGILGAILHNLAGISIVLLSLAAFVISLCFELYRNYLFRLRLAAMARDVKERDL